LEEEGESAGQVVRKKEERERGTYRICKVSEERIATDIA